MHQSRVNLCGSAGCGCDDILITVSMHQSRVNLCGIA